MIASIRHVIVTIPALDEARTIAACLASTQEAVAAVASAVTATVVVGVDARSDDGTAAIARRSLDGSGIVIEEAFGTVGEARRRATEIGLQACPAPRPQVWLATTDADTVVGPDWLRGQLELAADGAVAVAGVVDLHEPAAELDRRFRHHYVVHADGTHPHVHGANLGVRADVYLAAGGWQALVTGEDHDLWQRVRRLAPVVHTTAVRVATSPRYEGRAPEGFAGDLRGLESTA